MEGALCHSDRVVDDDFIIYSYEDLYSRNEYGDTHLKNFKDLLIKLNIGIDENKLNNVISGLMTTEKCYKTDLTYQNIANISELEKLKDYL